MEPTKPSSAKRTSGWPSLTLLPTHFLGLAAELHLHIQIQWLGRANASWSQLVVRFFLRQNLKKKVLIFSYKFLSHFFVVLTSSSPYILSYWCLVASVRDSIWIWPDNVHLKIISCIAVKPVILDETIFSLFDWRLPITKPYPLNTLIENL